MGLFAHSRANKIFLDFFLFLNLYRCAKFREKLTNKFREKLITDVRMDGRTDGWTDR